MYIYIYLYEAGTICTSASLRLNTSPRVRAPVRCTRAAPEEQCLRDLCRVGSPWRQLPGLPCPASQCSALAYITML